MPNRLTEPAPAKVNLYLHLTGRRDDGYHLLDSLVVFAGIGDTLTAAPAETLSLHVAGPFAAGLAGEPDNLVLRAARALAAEAGVTVGAHLVLDKHLPVASGIGGGSADAAAALRLIASANRGALSETAMAAIAARLGSDVTVCLANRPSLMTGRGEAVEPVGNFPACGVLLANPGIPLPAASVYAELRADDLRAPMLLGGDGPPDFHGDFVQLLVYALPRLNDLEAPAARLVPEIREVLAALLALDGPRLARMSGSGPTCFALFATEAEAASAGARLAAEFPYWWVAASALGG